MREEIIIQFFYTMDTKYLTNMYYYYSFDYDNSMINLSNFEEERITQRNNPC